MKQITVLVVLFYLTLEYLCVQTSAVNANEAFDDDAFHLPVSTVSVVVSVIGCLLLLTVVAMQCMDCMNSEVSSENHPACGGGDTAVKWGGASSGYSGGYVSGGAVNPGETQGLPYAMVPTQVPEQAGFAGYQVTGGQEYAGYGGGLTGYAAQMQGGNVNIMANAPEEPPPSYSETVNQR